MAWARIQPVTTSRDLNDVIKFPGRFATVTYVPGAEAPELDVIHRIQFATPAGTNLEPVDAYLAVKNNSKTDAITLYFQTLANAAVANPAMEATILPGMIAEYVQLDIMVVPTITSNTAADVECEVIYIGNLCWEEHWPPQ